MNGIVLQNADEFGDDMANSHILWDNYLKTAQSVVCNDNNDLIDNIFDGNTTSKWIKTAAPNAEIIVNLGPGVRSVNAVGFASGNWQSAAAVIMVYNNDDDTLLGSVSGLLDNQPHLFVFDNVVTSSIKIVVQANIGLRIGQVGIGNTMNLPMRPTTGMTLGRHNNNDMLSDFETEGMEFANRIRKTRMRENTFPYQGILMTWIDEHWTPFADQHYGKPIWFLWDSQLAPEQTVYGHWELINKINYSKVLYTDLTLKITGHVR